MKCPIKKIKKEGTILIKKQLITMAIAALLLVGACIPALAADDKGENQKASSLAEEYTYVSKEAHSKDGSCSSEMITEKGVRRFTGECINNCAHGATGVTDKRNVYYVVYRQRCTQCVCVNFYTETEYGSWACGR